MSVWISDPANPDMLERCCELANETYAPTGVVIFMASCNATFGGRRPIDMIREGDGQQVLEWLDSLAAGNF